MSCDQEAQEDILNSCNNQLCGVPP